MNLSQSISERDKQFNGILLPCYILVEASDKEVKTFYPPYEFVTELLLKLDFLGLYDRFIERKYEIYLQEKGKISKTKIFAKDAQKEFVKNIVNDH